MKLLNIFLKPTSTVPSEAFREQVIRVSVGISVLFFTIIGVFDLSQKELQVEALYWYGTIYILAIVIYTALHFNQVSNASRLLMFGMVLIVADSTAAYWSPGTIILGLIFTFIAQLVLVEQSDIVLAVLINLGIYTYIAFSSPDSPMQSRDYFASPITALMTTYVSHLIIIGISVFIRREQALRDKSELLIEQQRVAVLRQFLNHASHDLRTPLTRISTQLYLIRRKLPESSQESIDSLERSVADLEKILLSMLEITTLEDSNQLELCDTRIDEVLHDLIEEYTPMARKKFQTIDLSQNTGGSYVRVDQEYIHRALGNIIHNAIQYTPEHGKIKITTTRHRNQVTIQITDTGVGISAEQLPLIFDSFYRGDLSRNQSKGLNGLGLAISKKIIELHGGALSVQSEINIGTTFTLTLPTA